MDWLVRRPGPLSAISDLRLAIQDQFVRDRITYHCLFGWGA